MSGYAVTQLNSYYGGSATGTSISIDFGAGSATITSSTTAQPMGIMQQPIPLPGTVPYGQAYGPGPSPRQPAPREFNRYINASDLLEEFIRFLGEHKVRQGEVLKLPIDLFVKWLILRACEQDGEEPNVTLQLPPPRQQARCLGCGRWAKGLTVPFHDSHCAGFYYKRASLVRA